MYHAGAIVNWMRSYDSLRASNVMGTMTVIHFCFASKLKPLFFVSTIGVASTFEEVILSKEWIGYLNPYSQTKWVAEQLVVASRERGLPVTIYRPGMITVRLILCSLEGDSKTGYANPKDFATRYILGVVQLGFAVESSGFFDMFVSLLD